MIELSSLLSIKFSCFNFVNKLEFIQSSFSSYSLNVISMSNSSLRVSLKESKNIISESISVPSKSKKIVVKFPFGFIFSNMLLATKSLYGNLASLSSTLLNLFINSFNFILISSILTFKFDDKISSSTKFPTSFISSIIILYTRSPIFLVYIFLFFSTTT